MELSDWMMRLLDIPDEPAIRTSGNGLPAVLILAVIAVAAILLFLLFHHRSS